MGAVWFMRLSLVLAGASLVLGFWFPPATVGVVFALSALWYWGAIRWADVHGGWRSTAPKSNDKPNPL
jgi:uncharacterized membrane protein YphA (DoxX/SURF4 family)